MLNLIIEIELFDHFSVYKELINWCLIVSDVELYLEPFNFYLYKIELFEIELFDHLTACKQITYV